MPKRRPKSQGKIARVLAALALLAGLMLVALGLYRPHEGTRPVAASSAIGVPMPAGPRPAQPVVAPIPPVEPAPSGPRPAWQRNAVETGPEDGRPMIAIVIDDMGPDRARSAAVVALPGPLTVSFLAYADALPDQTRTARAHGHEVMLHVPMEPPEPPGGPGAECAHRRPR